jgi:hypothetical protein
VEGVILRAAGYTIPQETEREDRRRKLCEGSDRGGAVTSVSGSINSTEPTARPPSLALDHTHGDEACNMRERF